MKRARCKDVVCQAMDNFQRNESIHEHGLGFVDWYNTRDAAQLLQGG
jgi:hypothetical protein